MTISILHGDAITVLRTLDAESVDCVVTSPPYWGLRDYGVSGQIGLERTPIEYVASIVAVFREVRRVMKPTATLWLNLGDSYAQGGRGGVGQASKLEGSRHNCDESRAALEARGADARRVPDGLKSKDLIGIPWRVAFALQDDGWWLRSDIVWAKPNPMPESVTDRPTKAHEYVFLLAKSERYYYDADAVREPRSSTRGAGVSGWASGPGKHDTISHARDRGDARTFRGGQYVDGNKFENSHATARDSVGNAPTLATDRNARSVWTIATQGYPGAHFATFPEELPRRCIRAGSPAGGVVLDPFAGSGTTLAVARDLGRSAIGIELSAEYVALIEARCAQQALDLVGG